MITFSNMVLGRDFGGIIFGPFDSNSHLLNSLIMKAVYLGAGENPALMRLPNLVFALLAIALVYLVCSREFGRAPAFAAALLFSLHPAMVLFSVSGRGYAGMVLFTLISSILFLQLLRSFSWRRWLGCATAGFLAGASHLFAVNVLIAQVLLVVVVVVTPEQATTETPRGAREAHRRRRSWRRWSLSLSWPRSYLPQLRLRLHGELPLSLSDRVSPRSRQLPRRNQPTAPTLDAFSLRAVRPRAGRPRRLSKQTAP